MAMRKGSWLFQERLTKTMRRFFFSWPWAGKGNDHRTNKAHRIARQLERSLHSYGSILTIEAPMPSMEVLPSAARLSRRGVSKLLT